MRNLAKDSSGEGTEQGRAADGAVDPLDEELLRTGVVNAELFARLRSAYDDPARRSWARARLVPLATRVYLGLELSLHDPAPDAVVSLSSAERLRSWLSRYFEAAL